MHEAPVRRSGLVMALGTVLLLACAVAMAQPDTASAENVAYAPISGGPFRSILPGGGKEPAALTVPAFELQRTPVTNAEFLAFVQSHPEWSRERVAEYLADAHYLQHWQGPLQLGSAALPRQPVTNVSWFAARAYCEAQGARLPDWYEWEFAAAADAHARDARHDAQWQQHILAWYAKPSTRPLAQVGTDQANLYGVYDLHGLIWEWVEDFNALFIGGDNRNQGDPDLLKFCGSGALAIEDREDYPVMMRLAMLSSLRGNSTTANLGFRCARPATADYNAEIPLQTQEGTRITFAAPPGTHLRIVTMFYASCPMACPLTIETLHGIERRLTPAERARLEVLLITFDPAHDSPEVLKRVTHERHVDTARWTLARSAPEDVRRLSALLDIPYRALPDGSFNHASTFILMGSAGQILARTGNTAEPDAQFVATIRQALRAEPAGRSAPVARLVPPVSGRAP
jgi:formylglycine-generating enzyme required for sulfatase activity